MADHITHDGTYNTADRDDFASMIEVERYGQRSEAFNGIISATVDHFWDPTDPRYLDWSAGVDFDLQEETILPNEMGVELNRSVGIQPTAPERNRVTRDQP